MNMSANHFASPDDAETLSRLRDRLGLAAEAQGLLDVAYTTVDSPVGPLLLAATPHGLVRVAYDVEDHDRVLRPCRAGSARASCARRGGLTRPRASSTSTSAGGAGSSTCRLTCPCPRGSVSWCSGTCPRSSTGRPEPTGRSRSSSVTRRRSGRSAPPAPPIRFRVVVPCHRVLRADGTVGGYIGGSRRRRRCSGWRRRHERSGISDTAVDRAGREHGPVAAAGRVRRLAVHRRRGQLPRRRPAARLLTPGEAAQIRELYEHPGHFRSTVDMARHSFGAGEYRYFKTPYPEPVERLKQALYPRLLPIARDWAAKLGRPAPWPDTLDEWLRMCHAAGQGKSTAILLRYQAGRLECAAPRPLRRPGVPASSRHQPERAGRRP